MSDPFVAEIRIFAGNFAPRGWATCDGQLLPISQNTALFSLLGTTYGGDGKSTFALPNFGGSTGMQQGQGAGLSQRYLGETGVEPSVTLLNTEMPLHNHQVGVSTDAAIQGTLTTQVFLARSANGAIYQSNTSQNIVQMNVQALALTGGSQPHNNMQPYLAMTYIIAMQGIFPPRP